MASSIGSDGNSTVSYTSLHAVVSSFSMDGTISKLSSDSSKNLAANHNLALKNYAKASNATAVEDDTKTDSKNSTSNVEYLYHKKNTDASSDDDIKIAYGSQDDDDEEFSSSAPVAINSFASLAAAMDVSNGKITKDQLISYLNSLKTDKSVDYASKACEITMLKNLIAQFGVLSNGEDYITSLSGLTEAQDYKTVTTEQVTSPIDLRV